MTFYLITLGQWKELYRALNLATRHLPCIEVICGQSVEQLAFEWPLLCQSKQRTIEVVWVATMAVVFNWGSPEP